MQKALKPSLIQCKKTNTVGMFLLDTFHKKLCMHSWYVLEQTKTELVRTDKLKNMADNKGKSYMEESEVSKDYSEGSKYP